MFRTENLKVKDSTEDDEEGHFCMIATCESAATTLQKRLSNIELFFSSESLVSGRNLLEELSSSKEKYVQLDLGPVLAASTKSMTSELPFWEETLSGLDEPFELRKGCSRFILGSGKPKAWKNLQSWAP